MFLSKVVLVEYVDVLLTVRVRVLVVVVFVVDVSVTCHVADGVLEEVDVVVACQSVDVEVVEVAEVVEVEGAVLVVVLVVEVETFGDADSLASPDASESSESGEMLPARPNASIEVLAKSAVT